MRLICSMDNGRQDKNRLTSQAIPSALERMKLLLGFMPPCVISSNVTFTSVESVAQ